MPNRILRDWTDSLKFDGISAEAERLFVRLIMKADDYGRYHAEPRLLKAGVFPFEDVRLNELDRVLQELSTRQLILQYQVQNRAYLAIFNFGQRLRQSRAKFPPKDGEPNEWIPEDSTWKSENDSNPPSIDRKLSTSCGKSPSSSRHFPPDSETETDIESDTDTETRKETDTDAETLRNRKGVGDVRNRSNDRKSSKSPPLLEEVSQYCQELQMPPEEAEKFSDYWSIRDWTIGKQPIKDWKAAFRNWKRKYLEIGGHLIQPRGFFPGMKKWQIRGVNMFKDDDEAFKIQHAKNLLKDLTPEDKIEFWRIADPEFIEIWKPIFDRIEEEQTNENTAKEN